MGIRNNTPFTLLFDDTYGGVAEVPPGGEAVGDSYIVTVKQESIGEAEARLAERIAEVRRTTVPFGERDKSLRALVLMAADIADLMLLERKL